MCETAFLTGRTNTHRMGGVLSPIEPNGRRAALTIGVLILAQMAGSALVNFFAEAPLFDGGGFLVNAASRAANRGRSISRDRHRGDMGCDRYSCVPHLGRALAEICAGALRRRHSLSRH